MAVLVDRRSRRASFGRKATQLEAELGLDELEKPRRAEPVEHVAKARLLAIGPIAMIDEDTQYRCGDRNALRGATSRPQSSANRRWPVTPARNTRKYTSEASSPARSTRVATNPMSLVSVARPTQPPPSKLTLNLRGSPYRSDC